MHRYTLYRETFTMIHTTPTPPPVQHFCALHATMFIHTYIHTHTRKGSVTECKYQLMTFGIPSRDFPLTDCGKIKTTYLQTKWMKLRQIVEMKNEYYTRFTDEGTEPTTTMTTMHITDQTKEKKQRGRTKAMEGCSNYSSDGNVVVNQTTYGSQGGGGTVGNGSNNMVSVATSRSSSPSVPQQKTLVECPRNQDVLFYSGGAKWGHPGNAAFREILESRRVAYVTLAKKDYQDKRIILREIINDVVQGMDGQFLAWDRDYGCWELLRPQSDMLRERVSASLRDHCKRVKLDRANLPQIDSSIPSSLDNHPVGGDTNKRKWLTAGDNGDDDTMNNNNDDVLRGRRGFCAGFGGCDKGLTF
jgi:hypothetical protein